MLKALLSAFSGYDGERVQQLQSQGLNIDNRVIDNSKISDHHAIIPTNLIGRISDTALDENEQRIVKLVINRFLSVFDKAYIYTETKYEFLIENEIFKLTIKKSVEMGWKKYKVNSYSEKDENKEKTVYASYSENDTFTANNLIVKTCETKPPKHFTESSLLAVMENIDRLIGDKELKSFVKERGLGTPATRASIIEELISAGYISRQKKMLISTDFGKAFATSLQIGRAHV